jgi:membrane fusion protein (multidrug efflux system)
MKRSLYLIPVLLFAACGKPPPPEGMPSDFPVPSVVGKATRENLEERLPLVGSVRAKDRVVLQSEMEARVIEVAFEEGALMKTGQVLFRLDQRREEAAMAEAKARLARAEADLARGQSLLANQTIPPQEFDRLQEAALAAKANLDLAVSRLEDATVKAPFDGMIGEHSASVGQYVTRGGALATLTRIDPLEVEFEVPERFISQLALGQQVRLDTAAWPGEPFTAKVSFLAPEVDMTSRTLRVKGDLANPEGKLRPGMFGTIELVFAARKNALVIPEGAIQQMGDQAMVVAVGPEDKAEYRPVKTGLRLAGRVEITEGLKEGERVVVEGHQKIAPGATVITMPGSIKHGVEPPPPPTQTAKPEATTEGGDKP